MKKFATYILLWLVALALSGCSQSHQIARMGSNEIKGVTKANLCDAYKNPYAKNHRIEAEMARRDADCLGYKAKCRNYGFKEGTTDFSRCVMEVEFAVAEQNRAAAAAYGDHMDRYMKIMESVGPQTPAPTVHTNCFSFGNTIKCTSQ